MNISFIGCGNMAKAMIGGILKKGDYTTSQIMATAVSDETKQYIKNILKINTGSNPEAASWGNIVILAIKPVYMQDVIAEIKDEIAPDTVVISLAPGKSLEWLGNEFGKKVKLIRTMPNTPAMVGEGMTALCKNENITGEDMKIVLDIFESFGKAEIVSERLMDAVVGVSGSSPAFVFMFMEAMADAAVAEGMPRKQAYKFAAQSVLGSAKLMLETGSHPGELKDMVCSPAGTTMEGVCELEKSGFRASVISAVRAAAKKSADMK